LQRFITEDLLNLAELQLWSQRDQSVSLMVDRTRNQFLYNPQLLATYIYTSNNPLGYTDPYGLFGFGRVIDGLSPLFGPVFGPLADISGNVFDTSGDWGYYGGALGAGLGTGLCSPLGPWAAAGCGFGGGLLGGALGGLLDPPCAGKLNCDEPPLGGRKPKGRGASGGWGGGSSGSW
jgi:hypothetical protein